SEEMLASWLEPLGRALEDASLDYVLERHLGRVGEMVPTSSGEIESEDEPFTIPGLSRRDGRWVHEGEFAGAGGRQGHHSEDFELAVRDVAADRQVRVRFVLSPPWTSDRITPAGREALRSYGLTPPGSGGTFVPLAGLQRPASGVPCPFCGSTDTVLESAYG